jgi:predicted DNA-binding transcriptional regulator YafY
MSSKVIYQRLLWFNDRVKAKKFPNATTLAERFEVSRKTAQRDIEFMRDRLNAPLAYVPGERGYAYEDTAYELPGIWINEEELSALLISSRLASTIPDRGLKTSLKSFLDHIISLHSLRSAISLEELNERVSVKNVAYARIDEKIFRQVADALFCGRPLRVRYYSPHKDEYTERDILPLHLLQYMGNWHLIAHCALRNQIRDFALSRMRKIELSPCRIIVKPSPASIKEFMRKNFGLMTSGTATEVCLKFSPHIASWIMEQVWHPRQKLTEDADGSLRLTFPVADFKEIKREILRYGSQIEVIYPKEMREEVKKEITKMQKIYL